MTEDKRRERLRFRSWHRGMREMDLLLGTFADAHLHVFTPEQLSQYESLLEQSDPDLYSWVTGKEPLPVAQDNEVARKVCAHRFTGQQAI